MNSVSEICDAIGRAKLAALLNVKRSAVSNAAVSGQFPAKWFDVVDVEAERLGIDCPRSLFAFVRPNISHHESAAA